MKFSTVTRNVAATSAVLAVVGALCAPASFAGQVPTAGLIGEYLFSQTTGSTVNNTATGPNAVGPATVVNGDDGLWTGSSLMFKGGAKNSNADWVRLPENILAGKTSATIVTEVKIDPSMKSTYNFLWNIGNDASQAYYFASVKDAPRTAITTSSNGGEANARSSANLVAERWYSITSVIDGVAGSVAFYVDGHLVGQAVTSMTPASISDQSLNAIGRSPWPDPFFKGEVAAFRVYDQALNANEVKAIADSDATIHQADMTEYATAILDDLALTDQVVDGEYVTLPTARGAVTWTSSMPDVVTPNGAVNQPPMGSAPVQVVMTATATVRGMNVTKTITLTINPTTKTDQDRLLEAATGFTIPPVMVSGTALPNPGPGTSVTFTNAQGLTVNQTGIVSTTSDTPVTGTVDATVTKAGIAGKELKKTFTIKVLPAGSHEIVSYHRTPTSEDEANNSDIAYSMHLAVKPSDTTGWLPLNENYGVFFAKAAQIPPAGGTSDSILRTLKNPSVFIMKDGTYGVIATRTARGGGSDGTGTSSVLLATSTDLLSYNEVGLIDLGETNGVNNPFAIYDSASDQYILAWSDDADVAKYASYKTLSAKGGGTIMYGEVAQSGLVSDGTGIDDFTTGRSIPIDAATAKSLNERFGRITNTGYREYGDVVVQQGTDTSTLTLPETVTLNYSDGSTGSLPISNWDTSSVDTTTPGTYPVTGTVKQTEYPVPFADERADPSVFKFDWNGTTKYLMIATNDLWGDNIHQSSAARMPIRVADSITALSDLAGAQEIDLLRRGDLDASGTAMTGCFWAPEYHLINGRLSILFMPCYGNSPNMWTGRASIMQLQQDAQGNDLDPAVPSNWSKPEKVLRADGTDLNLAAGISLDMTFFSDQKGQAYYSWQQLGANFIAKVDPTNPTRLTSEPVRIVVPEYSWDNTIAEGPNVVMRNGKLYMIYSGSTVGNTYTTGLAVADASGNTDLTDPNSWTKLNYPIQKSGMYNGAWQLGTGHGMWSEDEDGNMIYVFHARTDHNGLSGRDMFVRRVHWSAKGLPVLDMEPREELAEATASMNIVVEAETATVDKQRLSEEVAAAGTLVETNYTKDSWFPFAQALSAGRDTLADASATQVMVNDALAKLVAARNALVKVDSVEPSAPRPAPARETPGEEAIAITGAHVIAALMAAVALLAMGGGLLAVRRRRQS